MIYWFTGQPGAGKTSIAEVLITKLPNNTFHVDGDDLREIFNNKDYSELGRRKNIELAQQISQYLHNQGVDVLVSLVSPYKDQRDRFKEKMGDDLREVYVHTSEKRGREQFFVKEYNEPTENYLEIDTTNESIVESAKKVLDYAKNSR